MIYRYDEPVDMPVPELYDTGLMGTYINAVKQQYDEGVKRLDDFTSKYGDFTSPFAKDVENWDKLTRDRMNNVIADLESRGIDPYRSQEGRAALAKAIRETPIGSLNKLQQSAKMGQEYQEAIQKLRLTDKYDPGFEQYLLEKSGIGDFKEYDTLSQGKSWDRVAPGVYQTLGKAVDNWYEGLKPTDKGKKNGYRYTGIDRNDLIDIAKPRAQAFSNTDIGGYYKKLIYDKIKAAHPEMSDEDLETATNAQFINDIADTQHKRLIMTPEADPYDMLAMKDKYDARSQARAHRYAMREKGATETPSTSYPASFTTMLNASVTTAQNNRMVDGIRSVIKAKQRYWAQQAKTLTSKKDTKGAANAKAMLRYWNWAEKDPVAKGLMTKDGKLTPFAVGKYNEYQDWLVRKNVGSKGVKTYMNAYTTELQNKQASTIVKDIIGGDVTAIPGTSLKHRTVDFGSGKYLPASYKVQVAVGRQGSRIQRMFANWLKSNNVRGYMTGGKVRMSRNPGSQTVGTNDYFVDTYVQEDTFKNFFNYYKNNGG